MNALTIGNADTTMTSREIADLSGKQHKDVLYDIRKMLEELGKAAADFSATALIDGPNNSKREIEIFNLPKREALILTSGYSVKQRAAIIDRWQELESKQAFQIPQTLPDALRLAADLADQNAKVTAQLAIAAPKAEALDLISAGTDTLTVTEAAKVLGVKRTDLTTTLHAIGWVYRQNGSWVAYDQHIRNGYLQYKEATYTDDKTGMECRKPYCHITPKGLAKLAIKIQPRAA